MLIELSFQISTTGMVITLVIVSVSFFVKVMSLKVNSSMLLFATHSIEIVILLKVY